MITSIFHDGSGIGNQLARYIAVRCLALDKGYDFSVINPENFKGHSFLDIDFGKKFPSTDDEEFFEFVTDGIERVFNEKKVLNEHGNDVRPYDPTILEVEDNTIVDGEFQDPRYFEHHLDEIGEWLAVEPLDMPDNLCVINFRGGEYVGVPDLFLPQAYWNKAIEMMLENNPEMIFEVHTDDPVTARMFFPHCHIFSDIASNWRSIRYAKYLILSNSSFAILPALLNQDTTVIAPLWWAGYNKGYWQLPQNQYKQFTYIHHEVDN